MISTKSNVPDLVEWLDLEQLHVHPPTTVIFLLGGKYDLAARSPPHSFRDVFLRVEKQRPLNRFRFRIAEDANLREQDEPYRNWLSFEVDLAQLFQLILLFSESEGSIAELGSFVMVDEIARKLMVVVDEVNAREGSFISDGVLQQLRHAYGKSSVYVLNYDGLNIHHGGPLGEINYDEFAQRLGRALLPALDKHKDPRTFDSNRDGHLIKLITGMIQHYGALTREEIAFILYVVGLPRDEERIKQFIRCATFMEWIEARDVGFETYYVPIARRRDAFQYALLPGAPKLDKAIWRALVLSHWKANDPERFTAILSAGGA